MIRKVYRLTIAVFVLAMFAGACGHVKPTIKKEKKIKYDYKFDFCPFDLNAYNNSNNNYIVSVHHLKSFLTKVKEKKTREAIKLGNTIFRVNSVLPRRYVKLMLKYIQPNPYRIYNTETYIFDVGKGCEIHLSVAPMQSLITEYLIEPSTPTEETGMAPRKLSNRVAFQLLKNYIDYYKDSDNYTMSRNIDCKPTGLKSASNYDIRGFVYDDRIRIIQLMSPQLTPPVTKYELVMDNISGEIMNKCPCSLAKATLWLFPQAESPELKRKIMSLIIALNQENDAVILNSLKDIPGYVRNKLDSDIEKIIIPAFTIISDNDKETIYVVDTYQKLGGIVRRYRFTFQNDKIAKARCIQLNKDIGDAQYQE